MSRRPRSKARRPEALGWRILGPAAFAAFYALFLFCLFHK